MALIPGSVRVAGFIAPSDTTDTYAVTDEQYNRGGYRTVLDIAARNAITADRRKEGMLVRLSSTGDTYVLVGGLLDANWTLFTPAGANTLQTLAVAEGATTPDPGVPTLVWSTTAGALLIWNGTAWASVVNDPDLLALANLNTTGFLVRTGAGTLTTRQLAGTPGQIQIFNGDGTTTSPSIALTNTGISAGTYTKLTVDPQGRVTAGAGLSVSDLPSNIWNLYSESFTTGAPAVSLGVNAVSIGNGAASSGENAISIGTGASAQSINSIALGQHSIARHTGAVMQAAGRFVVNGDAQVGSYILKGVTTTNIPRQLYLDGPTGTTPLILPDNTTWTYKITVTAHRSDVNDHRAGYVIKGVIFRGSGPSTTELQGLPTVEIISRSNLNWAINTSADGVNGCLAITVTGEFGQTVRWLAHVETVEITG